MIKLIKSQNISISKYCGGLFEKICRLFENFKLKKCSDWNQTEEVFSIFLIETNYHKYKKPILYKKNFKKFSDWYQTFFIETDYHLFKNLNCKLL